MAGRGRSGLGLSPSAPRRGWPARDPAASRVHHARAGPDGYAPARRRRCRRDAAHRLRRGYELLRRDGPASHHGRRAAAALRLGPLPRTRRSSASTVTSSPGSRLSPRSPAGSTATADGSANASSSRSFPAAACCCSGRRGPWMSPIHVEDCARALVHLAERGEPGGRYFLVNRDPIRLHEFAETFARLANRPLRVLRVPAVATRFVVGPVLADHLLAECGVLEHPAARDRLPLPVSHDRRGTPPGPRSAR